jgi:hypothetical protein
MKIYLHFCAHLGRKSLYTSEKAIFQVKVAEKNETHICTKYTIFANLTFLFVLVERLKAQELLSYAH